MPIGMVLLYNNHLLIVGVQRYGLVWVIQYTQPQSLASFNLIILVFYNLSATLFISPPFHYAQHSNSIPLLALDSGLPSLDILINYRR